MSELPKIVQQRLQVTKLGAHPEPDLLNAFAEQALAERERLQVLEHLSRCDDCREVIFLAQPELQVSDAATQRSAQWLRWPVLRWVAAAACVVVVGAAVSLRHGWQESSPRSLRDSNSERSDAAAPPDQNHGDRDRLTGPAAPVPASNSPTGSSPSGRETAASPPPISAEKKDSFAKNPPNGAPGKHPKEYRRGYSMARITPPPAVPMKPAQNENQANSDLRTSDELAPRPPVPVAAADTAAADQTGEDKSTASANAKKTAQWSTNQAMRANPIVPTLKWTLTSDGTLQRSADSGKTWQSVPVGKGVLLRAISSDGSEIWVGGAKGALFHSSDAGVNWVPVTPIVDGKLLTSDIVAIDFRDSRHGSVTTIIPELWTTTDGGQSWERK